MTMWMYLILALITQGELSVDGADRASEQSNWGRLGIDTKCALVRAILEARRPKPPTYCLLDSPCVRRWATLRERLLLNVNVRWNVSGEAHVVSFPENGNDHAAAGTMCGWSDVTLFRDRDNGKSSSQRELWYMKVWLYAIGDAASSGFAFSAQLVPTWRLPSNRVADSGCAPEYGFVHSVNGTWDVSFDRSARDYAPLAPGLKNKSGNK